MSQEEPRRTSRYMGACPTAAGTAKLITTRVPLVSAVQVGSSDPLEQPLTPDDHSPQRTEQEPIPNADDNDREVVQSRPSDCDVSLTYETPPKHRHARSCRRLSHCRRSDKML